MPPLALIDVSEQTGAAPESSVALTVTVTGTSAPLGGQISEGLAETLPITGAVVSGGTTTSTEPVAALPAASLHETANV